MKIIRYNPLLKPQWDGMVRRSKNATFLFCRDYMEYHSDRFTDASYMFYSDDDKLLALLPGSAHGDELRSHGGLTYGGLVMDDRTSAAGENSPLALLPALAALLRAEGYRKLIYKPVPHIYHRLPAEEDLYALFRCGAQLSVRNLASVISLRDPISSSRLGKRAVKRARKSGIEVEQVSDVSLFWNIIVEDRRLRHNVTPVHTQAEMQLLRDRFPGNILFFVARCGGETVAGAVVYLANRVLHLQYAAATESGKEVYAVDVIYHQLIFDLYPDARYFDFGTSNEDGGRYLNEGMVRHKEEFGARSIAYDAYTMEL